jgi:endoglucanase
MANDTNAIQLSRAGVATGCLGLPLRYMHSPVETIALADLETASELLAQFILAVGPGADFTPRIKAE